MATPQEPEGSRGSNAPVDVVVAPEPSELTWPSETELILVSGSNKIMLTVQRPIMRAVFQDTFERIRAAMVFGNAFPGVHGVIEMVTDNLIRAAESNDRATNIYNRLVLDGEYTTSMSRLVSLRILNTMMLLTSFPAPRMHPSFPWGGQGSLCRDDSG
jgi:hypothetical protein